MARAIFETCWMSLTAPEVTFSSPYLISSAALPAIAMASCEVYLVFEVE